MNRRSTALTVAVVSLFVLVAVALLAPIPYVVLSPGLTENTLGTFNGKTVVAIKGTKTYPTSGHLDLTTVSVTKPDYSPRLPEVLDAWWSSDQLVVPRDAIYPPDQTSQEAAAQSEAQMLDSQSTAIVAGLAQAGIDALDVVVGEVTEGAPADGKLQTDDVIEKVDGTVMENGEQTVNAIKDLPPGTDVTITVLRDGKLVDVPLTTEAKPDDESESRIGVGLGEKIDAPFDVKIQLGQDIGGPSAGMMFSLAIYDKITPGALTGGRFIAGTGTIDTAGDVGPIGGVRQKIAGAHENGATVFLVPNDDCKEAAESEYADDVLLVRVKRLSDAVDALEALKADDAASITTCEDEDA